MAESPPHWIDIETTVNGKPISARVASHQTLYDFLRTELKLFGVKLSCDMQVCGACTVLVDGNPVSSCTTLAYEARNKKILTIEGLAEGDRLHPLQIAFIEHGAFQCGFCTPGMILSAQALLAVNPEASSAEIIHFLKGNLCRCTGYKKIVEAVRSAAWHLKNQTP